MNVIVREVSKKDLYRRHTVGMTGNLIDGFFVGGGEYQNAVIVFLLNDGSKQIEKLIRFNRVKVEEIGV